MAYSRNFLSPKFYSVWIIFKLLPVGCAVGFNVGFGVGLGDGFAVGASHTIYQNRILMFYHNISIRG